MRTTRAPIVLGVCGWALAPRTTHPCVGSALGSFTWGQCPTVSGCAAHYHTLEQPQSLSTRRTCVSRGCGSTARPITSTHGPEDSTSRDVVPARVMAVMATPSARPLKKIRGWLGHIDSTPMDAETCGYPLVSLGLVVGRRESRPIVDGHHGHHGHPSGQTPQNIFSSCRWGC